MVVAIMHDGPGDLDTHGGFRTAKENWEQEKTEMVPLGVLLLVPIRGTASRN
jgi:hypothetical protein